MWRAVVQEVLTGESPNMPSTPALMFCPSVLTVALNVTTFLMGRDYILTWHRETRQRRHQVPEVARTVFLLFFITVKIPQA
jgi:hypothetical protein